MIVIVLLSGWRMENSLISIEIYRRYIYSVVSIYILNTIRPSANVPILTLLPWKAYGWRRKSLHIYTGYIYIHTETYTYTFPISIQHTHIYTSMHICICVFVMVVCLYMCVCICAHILIDKMNRLRLQTAGVSFIAQLSSCGYPSCCQ